jgi:hypothetical protein
MITVSERMVMILSKTLENVKFPGETFLNIDDKNHNFETARDKALDRVKTYDSDPMLVGWYDRKCGRESPSEGCEDEGSDQAWVRYAKAHGGNLTVNVNNGEYIFIYRSGHQFEDTPR